MTSVDHLDLNLLRVFQAIVEERSLTKAAQLLDLTQPGAPMKWKFSPYPASSSQGEACCDVVNRGAAYANGKVYFRKEVRRGRPRKAK